MNYPPGVTGTEDYFYPVYVCLFCQEIEVPEGEEWCEDCALHSGDDE